MKKSRHIITIALIVALILVGMAVKINHYNENSLVIRVGKVVRVVKDDGPFLIIPFFETVQAEYMGDQMYDLPSSFVITADKKQMIADAYSVWSVTDPLTFYQKVKNSKTAENRLDPSIYNSMKNIISSSDQQTAIGDETLGERIRTNIKMADEYGLAVTKVEMKLLDLPKDNKQGVFQRMISERRVIEAQYIAEGDKSYKTKTASVDSQVRQIESNAQVEAAKIEAEGESQYFQILANAYSSTPERMEFYNYLIELQALEDSFQSGTIILTEDSPFYSALNLDLKTKILGIELATEKTE
jgi:membrane protease subunit HflC